MTIPPISDEGLCALHRIYAASMRNVLPQHKTSRALEVLILYQFLEMRVPIDHLYQLDNLLTSLKITHHV